MGKKVLPIVICLSALSVLVLPLGCRGYPSKEPPIHLNPNMDTQPKGKAYRADDFWADGKYMRPEIEGTIARGQLKTNEHFDFGIVNGQPARSFPQGVSINESFMMRGQRVYDTFCAACHSAIGDGNSAVGDKLLVRPTSFHSEYMYGQPPGHFFKVISEGIRTMPRYGQMIREGDRWAVVAYVRALQISQDSDGQWIQRSKSLWKQE